MDGWMDEMTQLYSDVLQTWNTSEAVIPTPFFFKLKIKIFSESWQLY